MKFDEKINHLVEAINDVLISLGQPKLVENPDFVFGELSCESWLDARLERQGSVNLRFIVASSEIRIDIDRAEEALHIDPSIYQENLEGLRQLVTMLFTCRIRVERCGKKYTKIDFFDNNNECIDSITHRTSLFYLKLNCTTIEYPPIYES